jgi:methyl-accepting chemotaxis protein
MTGHANQHRDWMLPIGLVAQALLAAALCSAAPTGLAITALALGLGLWANLRRSGTLSAVATAAALVAMVGVQIHWSAMRELVLANAMVVVSLLPMLARPYIVLGSGLTMAALPFSAAALGLAPGAAPMTTATWATLALLCAQTLALAWRARVTKRSLQEHFDIEFLVRAMGSQGSIRLNFDVVRAETSLGRRLKHVQERMAGALRQARAAADGMQTDSRVLQSDSDQLRERTQRSAMGLRDAAMTLEQITTIVQASAHAAMEARVMAENASEQARSGAETFAKVSQRMHDIEQSSRKITDIVSVIDGIAFQTNILALNAAVEAARAGEQGRGFAVVAAEVRNLALRSAQAAGEVKVLINNSMATVQDGTELVRQADGRIQELVASVSKVGEVFAALSADTTEHAGSIDAVTKSVMELDELTRQNVSMAETTQGIAAGLLAHGTELDRVLSAFKLGSSSAPQAESEPAAPTETAAAAPAPAAKPRPAEVAHRAPVAPPTADNSTVTFF